MPVPTLAVRPVAPSDAKAMAALYRPYVEQTATNFEDVAPDAAEMGRRVAAHPDHPWLVATDTGGRLAGYAYALPYRSRAAYRWSVETSVYTAEPGRGVGSVLMQAVLDTCAAGGWLQAFAAIALPNDASVGLHERLGFGRVGTLPRAGFKHGRWMDVGWWHRPLADTTDGPTPPAPGPQPADVRPR